MPNVPAYNVKLKKASVRYTNEGSAKNLFTLPGGSVVLFFLIDVTTAFNDSGTDLLDVGTLANDDYYVVNADLSTEDQLTVNDQALGPVGTRQQDVYATYTGANNDATAGEAVVYCVYADLYNS